MNVNKLVFRVKEYGAKSNKVVFLFCPFGIPSWQLALPGLPIWRMRRAGFHVVVYEYDTAIAIVSAEMTVANIQAIIDDAGARIEALDAGIDVSCFGTSMGTVLACNVAAQNPRVKKVVLNLCYSDVAEHIVYLPPMLIAHPKLIKQYVAEGGGADGLTRTFEPYSPINLVDKLVGKQILLYLARNDRIHQNRHTKRLLEALRGRGVALEYYQNAYLGHYPAALKNHLDGKRYMSFLLRSVNSNSTATPNIRQPQVGLR